MTERKKIVALHRSGSAEALITLVYAEGSSYRRPGAMLLVAPSGFAGTISGGCLEAEVVRKAHWIVRNGAALERYSTLFDDTAEVPFGLGCGGTVTLLCEPTNTPEYSALMDALEASLLGKSFTVITWLPSGSISHKDQPFARAVLSAGGETVFVSPGIGHVEITAAIAQSNREQRVFIEQLAPPQRLIVFGAGDDAKPLVSMAALLGWTVVVVDGRSHLARPERFPEAACVLALTPDHLATLNLSPVDAVVLMTHSYEQDRAWLAAVLPVAPLYFGVLGAKHRSSLLVAEAANAIGLSLATCCERIYAPVGLDLGGDGPEAIALAVIAEAHARCMGRLGSSLRLSAKDVALHVQNRRAAPSLEAPCALNPAPQSASTI